MRTFSEYRGQRSGLAPTAARAHSFATVDARRARRRLARRRLTTTLPLRLEGQLLPELVGRRLSVVWIDL